MAGTTHPYENLPSKAFWRSGVAEASPFQLQDIYQRKFEILAEARIATAGSCFAQHVHRRLRINGCAVLDLEPPPPWLAEDLHIPFGYSSYSARYGNIYTLPQLAQLAREAVGRFTPECLCWRRGEGVSDALRPTIEPDGFSSEAELRLHRRFHLERVTELFRSVDVFIFTLGLTEAWVHRSSETIYPTAPGVHAGTFDEAEFAFVNFDYAALVAAFDAFLGTLAALRHGAPPRIVLTVSPVPLTATASGAHVLHATQYSKAVLRAFAGHAAMTHDFVDYFPSYEIVCNPAARGIFFDNNLRTVRSAGVDAAMTAFFAAHDTLLRVVPPEDGGGRAPVRPATDPGEQCEDAMLEAFAV